MYAWEAGAEEIRGGLDDGPGLGVLGDVCVIGEDVFGVEVDEADDRGDDAPVPVRDCSPSRKVRSRCVYLHAARQKCEEYPDLLRGRRNLQV